MLNHSVNMDRKNQNNMLIDTKKQHRFDLDLPGKAFKRDTSKNHQWEMSEHLSSDVRKPDITCTPRLNEGGQTKNKN